MLIEFQGQRLSVAAELVNGRVHLSVIGLSGFVAGGLVRKLNGDGLASLVNEGTLFRPKLVLSLDAGDAPAAQTKGR